MNTENKQKGKLIVLSGPSGVGKGTVVSQLDLDKLNAALSISMTTRAMRPGKDADGVTYYFVSRDEFEKNIREGRFLEYACYNGNYYGTPRDKVEKWLNEGKNVILEIETQGAAQVMKNYPDAVSIFLTAPSRDELEKRLRERATESEDKIRERMATAAKEMPLRDHYQYVVLNDELEQAVGEVSAIISAQTAPDGVKSDK